MTTAISDKTHVIVLRDRTRFFITENQFDAIKKNFDILEQIDIGKTIINKSSIAYMTHGSEYEEAEKIRKGYWQCEFGHWHSKNEECGHGVYGARR